MYIYIYFLANLLTPNSTFILSDEILLFYVEKSDIYNNATEKKNSQTETAVYLTCNRGKSLICRNHFLNNTTEFFKTL